MKTAGIIIRREEVQFFLRLHGLWEGIIALPPPPRPPFDIDTMEPLDVPPQCSWSDEIEPPPEDWWRGDETGWVAPELPLDEDRVLVLDADTAMPRQRSIEGEAKPQSLSEAEGNPFPMDEWPVYQAD
jgi:hypothetical protein